MDKPLVVIDCVVFLQSLIKETGSAVECINRFRQGLLSIATSKDILTELRDVLYRSDLCQKFTLLTKDRADTLVDLLRWKGELYRNVPKHFRLPPDPDDEPYLNLAIEAKADFIITRDNDLLDLMKWNTDEGREFQKQFRFLKIVTPEVFLNEMEKRNITRLSPPAI